MCRNNGASFFKTGLFRDKNEIFRKKIVVNETFIRFSI